MTFSVGTYKAVSGPMWQYGRCLHSATDHAEGLAFLALALTAGFVEEVSLKAGSSQRSYSAGVRIIGIRSCMSVRSEFAVVVKIEQLLITFVADSSIGTRRSVPG